MYRTDRLATALHPADVVMEQIRRERAVPEHLLGEARERRNVIVEAALEHIAARGHFYSGSLAHWTAGLPFSDADCGVIMDRRKYPELGPDGDGGYPDALMRAFRDWILPRVRERYPHVTCEIHTRALLFIFNEPIDGGTGENVDPSVDLILGLDRRNLPGLWIPNRDRNGWEASDPECHTEMFSETPKPLRVHRAREIRLAKAAVKNDGERTVMHSFNVEALALTHVTETKALAVGLRDFFAAAGASIAAGLTHDPAGVSGPISLPDGVTCADAARRLREMRDVVDRALHSRTQKEARDELLAIFPTEVHSIRQAVTGGQALTADLLSVGPPAAAAIALGSTPNAKVGRSYGGTKR